MNKEALEKSLSESLAKFDAILLEAVPEGAQMERIDRKFAFPVSQISAVLEAMNADYSIVEAAGKRISIYHSTYLDTEDLLFFKSHQRGYLHRDKIRFRSYPNTETTFLELKRKSNKGRTAKSRIVRNFQSVELDAEGKKFIHSKNPQVNPAALQTSAQVDYQRIQFISTTDDERFSIDFDISARFKGQSVHFGNIAILEVKQDRRFTSSIVRQMRTLNIHEASMSKYCLALTQLKPDLKSNRFKTDLRRLRKIRNEKF